MSCSSPLGQGQPVALIRPLRTLCHTAQTALARTHVLPPPPWALYACHLKGENEFQVCTTGISSSNQLSLTPGSCAKCSNRKRLGKQTGPGCPAQASPGAPQADPHPCSSGGSRVDTRSVQKGNGGVCKCTSFPHSLHPGVCGSPRVLTLG